MGFADFVKFRSEDYKLMQKYYPNSSAFKKLVYCWKKYRYQKKYNFAHMEFFCLHLAEKTETEVAQFFPRKHQAEVYLKVNSKKAWAITKDKYASYRFFEPFYKRLICAYNPQPNDLVYEVYSSYDWHKNVLEFLNSHLNFIIKPLSEASGHGVKIVKRNSFEDTKVLMDQLTGSYSKGFVLEELICQHSALAKYHPSSVNTIRINTFNLGKEGGVEIKFPCLRVGSRGSVVDNAGSGGLFAAIDEETGKIISAATNEEFDFYKEHPDTHVAFEGEIPYWNELITSAKEVAQQLPELKIAGLDFALDKENGWVLVEVNCEPQIIYEIATQQGIRDYMESFAKDCGVL